MDCGWGGFYCSLFVSCSLQAPSLALWRPGRDGEQPPPSCAASAAAATSRKFWWWSTAGGWRRGASTPTPFVGSGRRIPLGNRARIVGCVAPVLRRFSIACAVLHGRRGSLDTAAMPRLSRCSFSRQDLSRCRQAVALLARHLRCITRRGAAPVLAMELRAGLAAPMLAMLLTWGHLAGRDEPVCGAGRLPGAAGIAWVFRRSMPSERDFRSVLIGMATRVTLGIPAAHWR